MRVLLSNYRYFVSGGPERYMFNITEALENAGHEVIPFSVRYTRNRETLYSNHFVEPIGSPDEIYFREQRASLSTTLKTLERLFYARDVRGHVRQLAEISKPDVAYVLHYLRKMSPSLLVGLREAGLPIVVRLSDYQMLCPQAHFLKGETPCTLCADGNILPSIKHRCVQGSLAGSAANALATWFHRARHYFDLIDVFVVTNLFMFDMMRKAGVSESRLKYIPTFVKPRKSAEYLLASKEDIVSFVGRLEFLKGAHVLVEAAGLLSARRKDVGWHFKIAGEGNPEYTSALKKRIAELGLNDRIELCGNLDSEDVFDLLAKSRLQVVPSLWFENLPNSLLEGYASCTPAVASDLGSLRFSVERGVSGYLFKPGDPESLAAVLAECWEKKASLSTISIQARQMADEVFSEQTHMRDLLSVFGNLAPNMPS